MNPISTELLAAARDLSRELAKQNFAAPVDYVYDPLTYAWAPFERYCERFGNSKKRAVFLGMNPGPFGMMQVGVPFGEVAAVRDWMGIDEPVAKPTRFHPKRPIDGFDCRRSEVSGRRLWAWAQDQFGTAENFFRECFVINYCPLAFLETGGRNFTPDKLPAAELGPLYAACDEHLARVLNALEPQFAIGIGAFAKARIQHCVEHSPSIEGSWARSVTIGQVLHPSPASPMANRGWAEQAQAQLENLGFFK